MMTEAKDGNLYITISLRLSSHALCDSWTSIASSNLGFCLTHCHSSSAFLALTPPSPSYPLLTTGNLIWDSVTSGQAGPRAAPGRRGTVTGYRTVTV